MLVDISNVNYLMKTRVLYYNTDYTIFSFLRQKAIKITHLAGTILAAPGLGTKEEVAL